MDVSGYETKFFQFLRGQFLITLCDFKFSGACLVRFFDQLFSLLGLHMLPDEDDGDTVKPVRALPKPVNKMAFMLCLFRDQQV